MNRFKDKMFKEVSDLSKGRADIFHRLDQIKKVQTTTATNLGTQIDRDKFHICTKIENV